MKCEEFNSLPKAVQRQKVAADAILQIKKNVYQAKMGCWIELDLEVTPQEGEQVQDKLTPKNIKECHVCGLGALMVSAVRLKNSLKVPKYGEFEEISTCADDDGFGTVLRKIFTNSQIELIEIAFELGDGWYKSYYSSNPLALKAVEFGERFEKADDRLLGIMKNIIANKGTFKP